MLNSTFEWKSNLAYAVGLIASDGSLSKDGRHIDFTSKDIQLLETFKKCLSLTNRICEKSNYHSPDQINYHIQFGNVRFYNWLLTIGLMPNKTNRIGKLNIPQLYFRDFLRGYLDGDGSIFTYIDQYMQYKGKRYTYTRLYTALYSNSHAHLNWMQTNLTDILGIKGGLCSFKKNEKTHIAWKLRFAKNDSLKLLSWLYYKKELPCLNRKRKIAEEFLSQH